MHVFPNADYYIFALNKHTGGELANEIETIITGRLTDHVQKVKTLYNAYRSYFIQILIKF